MKLKKIIGILIIVGILAISVSAVSAGLFDFFTGTDDNGTTTTTDTSSNFSTTYDDTPTVPTVTDQDTLKKASFKLRYSNPVKSTDYAYFYQSTGEYAEAAYWIQYYFDGTIKLDVEKIYEKEFGNNSNYTLKDFTKDLKYMAKHNQIKTSSIYLNGGTTIKPKVTASLAKNDTVLVLKYSYSKEDYGHKYQASSVKQIKKTKDVYVSIHFDKGTKHDYKTGSSDFYIDLSDLPVKATKIS